MKRALILLLVLLWPAPAAARYSAACLSSKGAYVTLEVVKSIAVESRGINPIQVRPNVMTANVANDTLWRHLYKDGLRCYPVRFKDYRLIDHQRTSVIPLREGHMTIAAYRGRHVALRKAGRIVWLIVIEVETPA